MNGDHDLATLVNEALTRAESDPPLASWRKPTELYESFVGVFDRKVLSVEVKRLRILLEKAGVENEW